MDYELSPTAQALRHEVRAVIDEVMRPEYVHEAHETGTNVCRPLYRALGERGIIERAVHAVTAGDAVECWVVLSELEYAGTPHDAIAMVISAAAVIERAGTEAQKALMLPGMLAGESLVCFGLTEPDAGSDLAAIATRARLEDDEWVINGAKMWTTMAHVADWVMLLARSDPAAPPYQGFTFFVFPTSTPGFSFDPIWTMSTERSNATYYEDVRVGREYVLGEEEQGWRTLSVMLGFERGMGNTGFGVPLLTRAVGWAREHGAIDDPHVRDELARVAIDNEVAKLLTQRTVWLAQQGGSAHAVAGSVAKIFATESYQKAASALQALAAPYSLLGFDERDAAAGGYLDHDARHSVPQTLQGGTSEINRNNVAERGLGMPRTR
jgi:alkylation response protein AidB-like acyl-CoA dehydrogenase